MYFDFDFYVSSCESLSRSWPIFCISPPAFISSFSIGNIILQHWILCVPNRAMLFFTLSLYFWSYHIISQEKNTKEYTLYIFPLHFHSNNNRQTKRKTKIFKNKLCFIHQKTRATIYFFLNIQSKFGPGLGSKCLSPDASQLSGIVMVPIIIGTCKFMLIIIFLIFWWMWKNLKSTTHHGWV